MLLVFAQTSARLAAALLAVAAGVTTSTVAWIVAAGTGTDYGPIIGGIGNGVAVGALAYVVRSVLSGNLVARSSANVEARLFDLVDTSHEHVELLYEAFKKAGYPVTRPPQKPRRHDT